MRYFIAIELDEITHNMISEVQKELMNYGIRGNFTRKENLHLTLKFIGEIEKSTYNDICALLKKIALKHKLFVLVLDRIGKFDKGSKKILWAGLSHNKDLIALFKEIESELDKIMPIEKENHYLPHITLVREAFLPQIIGDEIHEKLRHTFEVNGISLMESTRVGGELTYIRREFESFVL